MIPSSAQHAERLVLEFIAHLHFVRRLRVGTVNSYVAVVARMWLEAGFDAPVWTPRVRSAIQGVARLGSEPSLMRAESARLPFTADLVGRCAEAARVAFGDTVHAAAVFAAIVVGFFFLLRRSEFIPGFQHAVRVVDVQFWWPHCGWIGVCDAASGGLVSPPECVALRLRSGKTDQLRRGCTRFAKRTSGGSVSLRIKRCDCKRSP